MTEILPRILVIDDDPVVIEVVSEILINKGYSVDTALSGNEVSGYLSQKTYPIVLCDILLPDTNGLELMSEIHALNPDTFVILFTGHASIELAKETIKQGAFDFITKPFTADDIIKVVARAQTEQRKKFSDLAFTEIKNLHELTISSKMSKFSRKASLITFAKKTAESFSADSLRIYMVNQSSNNALEKIIDVGKGSFADEVTWYFLAGRTQQSNGEVLLDPSSSENSDMSGLEASFMGTIIPTTTGNLGVILAGREGKRDRFKIRDLKMLALYAAQLGNQLQNLDLTENLVKNNKELEEINIVSSNFSASLDISAVVSSVARGLRKFIPFDVAGLFISLENGSPYNYILMNEAIPHSKVFHCVKRQVSRSLGKILATEIVPTAHSGTFVAETIQSFDNPPEFTITELNDYGKIQGWLLMGSWSGRSKLHFSSKFIPILLRHATSALCNSLQHRENENNYLETITALAQAVDAKDKYTNHHSRNVTAYTLALADKLGITGQARRDLWNAALLHDIGKIGIPENILNKPGKLTDEEYEVIKTHPTKGCEILIHIKAFKKLLPAIKHHHERFDGRGYPDGLKASKIPMSARILTIADSFDAMTSNRIYRKSPGVEFALKQLEDNSGTQFDPSLAKSFIQLINARSIDSLLNVYGSVLLAEQPDIS